MTCPSESLSHFVRHVLGCGCPERILESIRHDPDATLPGIEGELDRVDSFLVRGPTSLPLRYES